MSRAEERAIALILAAKEDQSDTLKIDGISTLTLSVLPSGFEDLQALTSLDLSYNQFSSLPPAVKKLKHLETLNLSRNRIRSFESFNIGSLLQLNLSHNQLSAVSFLPAHQKLTILDISYNRITSVKNIHELKDIVQLNFDFNGISHLPDEFRSLQHLNSFSISANLIREVPPSLSKLQLSTLDITHNKISILNPQLSSEQIPIFKTEGNPISDAWQSKGKKGTALSSLEKRIQSQPFSLLGQQRFSDPHACNVTNLEDLERRMNRKSQKPRKNEAKDYVSLISIDVRSNLLLRAMRVRIDCRGYLETIKLGETWILLPPNIMLGEFTIDSSFVSEHLIQFKDGDKKEFISLAGKHGTVDFDNKMLSLVTKEDTSICHHSNFEILQFGEVSFGSSSTNYLVMLINDTVATNAQTSFVSTPKKVPRTLEKVYEVGQLRRRKFEGKMSKFVKSFRRDLSTTESLPIQDALSILNQAINKFTETVFACSMFSSDSPPTKSERLVVKQAIRKFILRPLYDILFYYDIHSLKPDQFLAERIRSLQWILPFHLDLPSSILTAPNFSKATETLLTIHKEVCPFEKLQLLLRSCTLLYQCITNGDPDAAGADIFLPALILFIIKSNPIHFPSDLRYIETFCWKSAELCGEPSYYYINACSAIEFIKSCKSHDFNIQEEEYARNMAKQENLPSIQNLSFLHHTLQDVRVSDIPLLLSEYQNLATWFISTIDKREMVAISLPGKWGLCRVRDSSLDQSYRILHIQKKQDHPWEWLKSAISSHFGQKPSSLSRVLWLPDILLCCDDDCHMIWDVLSKGEEVSLIASFSEKAININ